jgi:uncharacterized protein (DUF427 family)
MTDSADPIPDWVQKARAQWRFTGRQRPPFALPPGPHQVSVWDFPRPPALVPVEGQVKVERGGHIIAVTRNALAILETSHPPTYYFPRDDVNLHQLRPATGKTFCEWKGHATYFDVMAGPPRHRAAWTYEAPFSEYLGLSRRVAFMAQGLDCWVAGEKARPQPGGYYGGWITSRFVGPFKGEAGVTG